MTVHASAPPALVSDPHGIQYATGSHLGKGGFAVCYKANIVDNGKQEGRAVALKIVKSKMEPAKLAQKFVTELQLHSKIQHPNIVEFYRAFPHEENTYVVLELCENGSVADALRKRKFFTMPEIRRFVIQICGAVKYLHHRNIIHRDLKTGNLFLDENMNIKVGDFGLAAVLVTKHDLGARRTTMCGTPNYLAPEILEKGGKGHNEKVDLWSIGIIAYTLAVGKAPFHAAKREEIYKKLQLREYAWPDLSKHENDISQDLRDLVGSLLVHEDDRPNPDQIVSHCFFKTKFVPTSLSKDYLTKAPRWSNMRPPTAMVLQRGYSDSWFTVCESAGVGEVAPSQFFPVHGGRKTRSVVRDCEKELAAGRQPVVPLPAHTVYVPYPERTSWSSLTCSGLSEIVEDKEPTVSRKHLTEINANERDSGRLKRPIAAVRKASGEENTARQRHYTNINTTKAVPLETVKPKPNTYEANKPEKPLRPTATRSASGSYTSTAQGNQLNRTAAKRPAQRSRAKDTVDDLPVGKKQCSRKPVTILADDDEIKTRVAAVPECEIIRIRKTSATNKPATLVTDPANVLARACRFRDNLALALSRRGGSSHSVPSRAPSTTTSSSSSLSATAKQLPFVSKWVDYSRKHGVGYVLEDGGIGCIFNASAGNPVTCVVVRNGYKYLKDAKGNPQFLDSLPMEHYADCKGEGVRPISVTKERQRSTGLLWTKFGLYMCQQLGQVGVPRSDADAAADAARGGTFVKFHQRLGSTGIWGFGDGAFQFNFPDHTKLVISADGKQCSFTCLPIDGARELLRTGQISSRFIRQRVKLSEPVAAVLSPAFHMRAVVEANVFASKIEFVVGLFDAWAAAGGIGCLPPEAQRFQWEGPQLAGEGERKRGDWVTVGRFGGDAARV